MLAIYARTSPHSDGNMSTSIEQQIQAGIDFANDKTLEYRVYKDVHISGYKIEEDEDKDPFDNRPSFTKLINDIKAGQIKSLYVWEQSRISRNQYAFFFIYKILLKYNITLYIKDREFDLSDPQQKMMMGVMSSMAEYERWLIVDRTTRGSHDSINNGKRAHARFYGYKIIGRSEDKKHHTLWAPVQSEIDTLKYCYEQYLGGKSLRTIAFSLINNVATNDDDIQKEIRRTTKLARFLKHAEYTSYSLNMNGLEILHKFERNELQTLSSLSDINKYWVKNESYTVQIISIPDWIRAREQLQVAIRYRQNAEPRKRQADKSLGTGLIQCSVCKEYYYYYTVHYMNRVGTKKGTISDFTYYYHKKLMNNTMCSNRPKSINLENTDVILDIFMFYFMLVFDNSREIIKEALKQNKIEQEKLHDSIKSLENDIKHMDIQRAKLNTAMEESDSPKAITIIAEQIADIKDRICKAENKKVIMLADLEEISKRYEATELERTYLSLKDKVVDYFEKYSNTSKRNEINKVAKELTLYGQTLLISTGSTIFLLDVKEKYNFPDDIYAKLKDDTSFYNLITGKKERNRFNALSYDKSLINNIILDKDYEGRKMYDIIEDFLSSEENISYDLSKASNFVIISRKIRTDYMLFLAKH